MTIPVTLIESSSDVQTIESMTMKKGTENGLGDGREVSSQVASALDKQRESGIGQA